MSASYFRQDFLTTSDGARIYFQVEGEGDLGIVLCDGLGCDGFAWKYLQPQLKDRFRVLRWHYRGHGKSGIPDDRDRIGMIYTCDDLNAVMDAASMTDAVLFGHSMGVQVALEFHRRFSSRVRGLVLLCGSPGNPLDTFHDGKGMKLAFPYVQRLVEKFPDAIKSLLGVALKTELAMEVAISVELNRELLHREDLIPYFDHLAKMDPVVFARTLHSLAAHTAEDHLPHVDVPTLVIGGERDHFTPVWLSKKLAERIPGSDLLILPGGSHTAPLEHPAEVKAAVEKFLKERILKPKQRAAS
ncbi:MAG: alpha/beta fold hydrolase [Myxococcaceae bacterium]